MSETAHFLRPETGGETSMFDDLKQVSEPLGVVEEISISDMHASGHHTLTEVEGMYRALKSSNEGSDAYVQLLTRLNEKALGLRDFIVGSAKMGLKQRKVLLEKLLPILDVTQKKMRAEVDRRTEDFSMIMLSDQFKHSLSILDAAQNDQDPALLAEAAELIEGLEQTAAMTVPSHAVQERLSFLKDRLAILQIEQDIRAQGKTIRQNELFDAYRLGATLETDANKDKMGQYLAEQHKLNEKKESLKNIRETLAQRLNLSEDSIDETLQEGYKPSAWSRVKDTVRGWFKGPDSTRRIPLDTVITEYREAKKEFLEAEARQNERRSQLPNTEVRVETDLTSYLSPERQSELRKMAQDTDKLVQYLLQPPTPGMAQRARQEFAELTQQLEEIRREYRAAEETPAFRQVVADLRRIDGWLTRPRERSTQLADQAVRNLRSLPENALPEVVEKLHAKQQAALEQEMLWHEDLFAQEQRQSAEHPLASVEQKRSYEEARNIQRDALLLFHATQQEIGGLEEEIGRTNGRTKKRLETELTKKRDALAEFRVQAYPAQDQKRAVGLAGTYQARSSSFSGGGMIEATNAMNRMPHIDGNVRGALAEHSLEDRRRQLDIASDKLVREMPTSYGDRKLLAAELVALENELQTLSRLRVGGPFEKIRKRLERARNELERTEYITLAQEAAAIRRKAFGLEFKPIYTRAFMDEIVPQYRREIVQIDTQLKTLEASMSNPGNTAAGYLHRAGRFLEQAWTALNRAEQEFLSPAPRLAGRSKLPIMDYIAPDDDFIIPMKKGDYLNPSKVD